MHRESRDSRDETFYNTTFIQELAVRRETARFVAPQLRSKSNVMIFVYKHPHN